MTDDAELAPPPTRQLVKDGVWQVPPEQRPRNWQAMAVREYEHTETHTHTKTTRAAEVVIQEHPEPTPAEVIEVTDAIAECSTDSPQIISYLPKDGDYIERIIDRLHRMDGFATDDEEEWSLWEQEQEKLCNDQTELTNYRAAKVTTDLILSDWVDRHRAKLKHVGIGSIAIQDLWKVVHRIVMAGRVEADRRVELERQKKVN